MSCIFSCLALVLLTKVVEGFRNFVRTLHVEKSSKWDSQVFLPAIPVFEWCYTSIDQSTVNHLFSHWYWWLLNCWPFDFVRGTNSALSPSWDFQYADIKFRLREAAGLSIVTSRFALEFFKKALEISEKTSENCVQTQLLQESVYFFEKIALFSMTRVSI